MRHCYIGPVYPTAKWRSRRVRVKGVTQAELRKMRVVELLPYISANFGWIRNGGPQPSRASVKSEFCEIKDVPTAKWWLSTVLILKVKEYSCQHKGLTMTIIFQQLRHKRYLIKQPRWSCRSLGITPVLQFLNGIINFEENVYRAVNYKIVNYKIVASQWASTISPEKFVETEDIQAAKEEVPL